jgi:DNA-binding winged helix-turn-helix (wHTH) protein
LWEDTAHLARSSGLIRFPDSHHSGVRRLRLRFGDCLFDSRTRELHRDGQGVPLPPKTFRLLEVLLENRPRALSKQEIHELIWPRTHVSESSLARLAAELRVALADDSDLPRYIRTARSFGYAFCGEAIDVEPERSDHHAACRVLVGEAGVSLPPGEHVVGRSQAAAVRINSTRVSRQHARILVSPEGARIEDLGSRNGTYVGGKKIDGPTTLADGDEILIGHVPMTFCLGPGGSTETDAD